MCNQEAIDILKTFRAGCGSTVINQALDVALAAIEKQEPVEPENKVESALEMRDGTIGYYGNCPICGHHLDSLWIDKYFCSRCGQKLRWE